MRIRAITFDVYSALFDTVSTLTEALRELFTARGISGDAAQAGRTWRAKQREYLLIANSLDREPALNRKAIEAGARFALRDLVPPTTTDEMNRLVAAWERLPPWPDVAPVLAEVRRRSYVMATLSNGDEAMQRRLLAQFSVKFDHVISTEGGKFKPHPSAYQKALDLLGVRKEDMLHVAGSSTDAMGATAFGIRTVWVNRTGDAVVDPRLTPASEITDLSPLLPLLDREPADPSRSLRKCANQSK